MGLHRQWKDPSVGHSLNAGLSGSTRPCDPRFCLPLLCQFDNTVYLLCWKESHLSLGHLSSFSWQNRTNRFARLRFFFFFASVSLLLFDLWSSSLSSAPFLIIFLSLDVQILGRALGGRVERAKSWDIGLRTVQLSPSFKRFSSLELPAQLSVIECHQDEVQHLTT